MMAYHRRRLNRDEEDAVREGFSRLAQIDNYTRVLALNERGFIDDFLLEVAPYLSRRLACALWRAIAGEAWSIHEERFVDALAIARYGEPVSGVCFVAMRVSGRHRTRKAQACLASSSSFDG